MMARGLGSVVVEGDGGPQGCFLTMKLSSHLLGALLHHAP